MFPLAGLVFLQVLWINGVSGLTDSEISEFHNTGCAVINGVAGMVSASQSGSTLTIVTNGVPNHMWQEVRVVRGWVINGVAGRVSASQSGSTLTIVTNGVPNHMWQEVRVVRRGVINHMWQEVRLRNSWLGGQTFFEIENE